MNICVYCSAKDSIGDEYKALGQELGSYLAEGEHTLIFGGATGGLMTQVSATAFNKGAEVIGVITKGIIAAGRRSDYCTQLIQTDNMSQRKQTMRTLADCFVCLPGSYGTLDEMFDVIASGTVNEHHKPCLVLNYKGFYNPLINMAQTMRQLGFLPQTEHYKPVFADSLDEIKSLIAQIQHRMSKK